MVTPRSALDERFVLIVIAGLAVSSLACDGPLRNETQGSVEQEATDESRAIDDVTEATPGKAVPPAVGSVEDTVTKMNLKSIVARVPRRPTEDGVVSTKALGAIWGDGTPIHKVEVRVDDGDWRAAELAKKPRPKYFWTFFSIDLGTLKPGKHTIVSGGVDANGQVQPSAQDDEITLKKTYWEAYQQWPREIDLKA